MGKNPILSIYIPTFNRLIPLVELLNSIRNILPSIHREIVEIVVSDNASTDSTYDVMKIALDNKFIDKYIRKSENFGADVNISDCFQATNGEFIWILCDDDLPCANSIGNILNVIKKFGNQISLIYLNRSTELMSGEVLVRVVTECQTGINDDLSGLIKSPGVDLLTASTLVLKRQTQKGLCYKKFGEGLNVASLTLALDALTLGPTYLFSDPQLRYREGDKSGWVHEWSKISMITVPAVFKFFVEIHGIDA